MIIDTSYFLPKDVFIPNVVSQPSIGSNTPNNFDSIIDEISDREREVLISFLGFDQFEELIDQFEKLTPMVFTFKTTALQKWIDLVNGKDNWKGLRYTVGSKKISLIAYYFYFHYLAQDFSTYTTTGVVISDSANSVVQTPNQKQAKVWNKFVSMANGINRSNGVNYAMFQNFNGQGIQFGQRDNNELSLYDFMSLNSQDYDLSHFIIRTVINPFGL